MIHLVFLHRFVCQNICHWSTGRPHKRRASEWKIPLFFIPLELSGFDNGGVFRPWRRNLVDWKGNSSKRIPFSDARRPCCVEILHDHAVCRKLFILGNSPGICPKFFIFESGKRQYWSIAKCIYTDAYRCSKVLFLFWFRFTGICCEFHKALLAV